MPSQKRPNSPSSPKSSPYSAQKQTPQKQAPAPSRKPAQGSKPRPATNPTTKPQNRPARPAPASFGPPAPPIAKLPVPCAMVTRRASEALRRDHLWVYASDIEQIAIASGEAPALIPVVDNRGILLGTALYSP